MNDKIIGNEKNIIFYNDEDGNTKIEVLLENENVWLNTEALAMLFDIDRSGNVRHINNIYKNEELIALTKELVDTLRKNKQIDWQKRESARAKMRIMIRRLLKRHRYPPEGEEDAVQIVMTQCELWTDSNDMED